MMQNLQSIGLEEFLRDYPGMRLTPIKSNDLIVVGNFRFTARYKDLQETDDSYSIEIAVSNTFPRAVPKVKETGGRIPNDERHHINSDGTLSYVTPP